MNTALFDFLRALGENNNREWFRDHKAQYDALHTQFADDVQRLIEKISVFDPEIAGLDAKSCIYRIYRDIRFSADKTPYKTHFGAYMTGYGGRTSPYAGYYVHMEPGRALLSGGVWCPPPPLLKKLRMDIYNSMDEFEAIVENRKFKAVFAGLEGEMLKRTPPGYPPGGAYDHILRHKDFIVSSPRPDSFFCSGDWIERTVEVFRILQPFNRFLNYTVSEFFGKA
ncbi:MAG: DUF2461 domain-containing protein [Tannerella sp.]|nr:DUF2461 domain-containing protein [Tannerella sp.]